jgi:hypothetical protein
MHPDWKLVDASVRERLTDAFLALGIAEIEYQVRVYGRVLTDVERLAMLLQAEAEAEEQE